MPNRYEINDALNKPLTRLGVDWRICVGIMAVTVLIGWFQSILVALVFCASTLAAVRLVNHREPQRFRLWSLSFAQFSYYDPGKRRSDR